MSKRTPAGDKGTADRIEADDGGYWVRLVTKQAMRREGECMQNCLRQGAKHMLAGDEETLSSALWSLRKRCGTSYALAEVGVFKTAASCQLGQFLGPCNHPPSPWAVQQIRHLRALFAAADLDLWFDPGMALVGPDGMTYRPDKAPADLRAAAEAERIECERQLKERQAAYQEESMSSMRSMPGRRIFLEEVDEYRPFRPFVAPTREGLVSRADAISIHQRVVERVAASLRRAVGEACQVFTDTPGRPDPASPFGLTSIPGLEVTFVAGGPSGFTRATVTPPTPGARA